MSSEAVQKYSDRADKEPSIERLRAASTATPARTLVCILLA